MDEASGAVGHMDGREAQPAGKKFGKPKRTFGQPIIIYFSKQVCLKVADIKSLFP